MSSKKIIRKAQTNLSDGPFQSDLNVNDNSKENAKSTIKGFIKSNSVDKSVKEKESVRKENINITNNTSNQSANLKKNASKQIIKRSTTNISFFESFLVYFNIFLSICIILSIALAIVLIIGLDEDIQDSMSPYISLTAQTIKHLSRNVNKYTVEFQLFIVKSYDQMIPYIQPILNYVYHLYSLILPTYNDIIAENVKLYYYILHETKDVREFLFIELEKILLLIVEYCDKLCGILQYYIDPLINDDD